MADRTVSVKLIADAKQYIQGLDEAARKTRDASATIEQRLAAQRDAFNQVGAAATAVGVLALAGVTAAVAAYAQFDAAMSGVQAATHESAENMQLLSDAALEAGQRTVFSATESAAAIENLARAGISTAEILGGALDGALDLAAAGEIEVADAAEIAASAMTQFGLAGDDVTHVADLLAAGAGKAQGGVEDLAAGLNQSGLVAAQMGLSIEETVGSLTAFASAGLIGSDAGTSFRSMLLRLANPTKESATLMDELGLSFYDSQGAFIGVEGMAGQLQERLADLTQEQRNQALAQIFGQDAIRTSAILYEQGAEGVREWTEAVDESGYASETAALRLDNLKGDLEQLGGAFETLMINLGAGADGPLRGMTQGLTGLVEWLGNLDPVAQTAILGMMGLVGAVGLVGGGALLAIPKIAEFKVALGTLGLTAADTKAAIEGTLASLGGPAIIAIGAVTLAVGALIQESQKATATTEEWTAALDANVTAAGMFRLAAEAWGTDWMPDGKTWDGSEFITNLENVGSYLDLMEARADNAWAALNPANIELDNSGFVASMNQIGEAISQISDPEEMQAAFSELVDGLGLSREQAEQLLSVNEDLRNGFLDQAAAADVVVASTDGTIDSQALLAFALGETEEASEVASRGIEGVAAASESAAEQVTELFEAHQALVDGFFAAQDAMSAYEQTIDDITEAMSGEDALVPAVTEARDAFDLTEQSGRDAAGMLQDLVTNAQEATATMVANGEAAEDVAGYQDAARTEIERVAKAMGLSEDAAREYADRLLEIPEGVETDVTLTTSTAEARMREFLSRKRVITVDVDVNGMPSGTIVRPGQIGRYAAGGRIPGYAPGYDDRLGFLSNGSVIGLGGGEFIMPTLMTDKYLHILEQMRVGAFPGYASGGRVAMPSQQPSYRPVINVTAPGGGGGGVQISQVVQPAPGMSEQAFADRSAAAIAWELRSA